MQGVQFWLITLYDTTVALHLVGYEEATKTVKVLATGLSQNWNGQIQNLIQSVEVSKDGCSQLMGMQSHTQIKKAAFVVSPYWVSVDGKISADKKQIIETLCSSCQIQPIGFSSYDEALAEYISNQQGQINTVITQVLPNQAIVSLVVSGKVRQRQYTYYPDIGSFSPKVLEDTLFSLKAAGVLPPEMIVIGDSLDNVQSDQLLRYHWTGKGGKELFIQAPNIKKYNSAQVAQMYAEFVISHLYTDVLLTPVSQPQEELRTLPKEVPVENTISDSQEVNPSEFGFGDDGQDVQVATPVFQEMTSYQSEPEPQYEDISSTPSNPPTKALLFIFPVLVLLIIAIIATITSKATLVFYTTALAVDKSVKVTLDTQAKSFDPIKSIVPVVTKDNEIEVKSSVLVTGKKQTGEKAKGEAIIYNKSEKPISIAKNTVLKDSTGRRFVLLNNTTIAPSQANLEAGVISLGQTKALLVADAIGPDGNISKDVELSFDSTVGSGSLLAKSASPFTGGSSRDITVVSKDDRAKVDKALQDEIKLSLEKKMSQDSSLPNLLSSTVRIVKGKSEYNRELDEEATTLEGTLKATVSVMSITTDIKSELISTYLKQDNKYQDAQLDNQSLGLSFTKTTLDDKQATGTLKISGTLKPQVDTSELATSLSGKKYSEIQKNLTSTSSRIYDYSIQKESLFGKITKLLPFNSQNINLVQEVK